MIRQLIAATALMVSSGTLPISFPAGWHVAPKQDIVIARWADPNDTVLCLDQVTTGALSDLDTDLCNLRRKSGALLTQASSSLCGMATATERYEASVGGQPRQMTVRMSRDEAGNIFVLRRIARSEGSAPIEAAIADACPRTWWALPQPRGFNLIASDDPTPVAMFKQTAKHAVIVFSILPTQFFPKGLAAMQAQLRKQGRTMTPATFCGHSGYLFDMSLGADLIDVGMDYDSTMAIVPGPRYVYLAADMRDRGAKPDPESLAALAGMCADPLPPIDWPYPRDAP